MKPLKSCNIALALTCVIYSSLSNAQLVEPLKSELSKPLLHCIPTSSYLMYYFCYWHDLRVRASDYKCRAKVLDINHNTIIRVPTDSFKEFHGYETIIQACSGYNDNLMNFNADLSQTSITTLTIHFTRLELGNSVRFNNETENIIFSNNIMMNIPDSIAKNLTTLRPFYLDNYVNFSHKSRIEADLNLLRDLNLCQNEIKLPDRIFQNLPILEKLDLTNNQISSLESHIFADLKTLRRLNLSQNCITHLPGAIFQSSLRLKYLNLHWNRLNSLESNIFADLKELHTLDISRNVITDLPDGIFRELSMLRILDLHWNRIRRLDSNIFADLKLLKILRVSCNAIEGLPDGIFRSLTELTKLDLHGNEISCLRSNTFVHLNQLQTLNISNNSLFYLLPATFIGLKSLSTLDLRHNNLSSISGDLFTFHYNSTGHILPDIYVLNNNLTHLPYCLSQLKNVYYLNTSSINYTGQLQPENTATKDICNGTEAYDYPSDRCIPWEVLTTERYPTTTKNPESKKQKPFGWLYYVIPASVCIVLASLVCLAREIREPRTTHVNEVASLSQRVSELRQSQSDVFEMKLKKRNTLLSRDLKESHLMEEQEPSIEPSTSKERSIPGSTEVTNNLCGVKSIHSL